MSHYVLPLTDDLMFPAHVAIDGRIPDDALHGAVKRLCRNIPWESHMATPKLMIGYAIVS
ncbi:hypothetical protein DPMN_008205 [Dreissena polymorpha]|uniref:Uncharacterized protein n=1 Tax=Dreissena polymorpha TaxID=45954 RepID=A0A9D4MXX5_DREPO|nr:hypothetical protein DPMN_008205 [Dreissena polymorpha]